MKILISASIVLFLLGFFIPSQYAESVLENNNYTLEGWGFSVSEKSVEVSSLSINFEIKDSVSGKILEFEKGSIVISGNEFNILDNINARLLRDGNLFRLSGATENGDRLSVFGKIIDESKDGAVYSVRGVLVSDSTEKKRIAYSAKITKSVSLLPQSIEEEMITEKTDLIVIIKQPRYTYWEKEYVLTARAYDAEQNPTGDFNQNWGYLQGVKVNVTITDEEGKILTSFDGETDDKGYFVGKYFVQYRLDRIGKYNVEVVANYGSTISSQTLNTFIIGPIGDSGSTP